MSMIQSVAVMSSTMQSAPPLLLQPAVGTRVESLIIHRVEHTVCAWPAARSGQRIQERPEVRDLVRLPGFRDPVLGDDQIGDVGDRGERTSARSPNSALSCRPRCAGFFTRLRR
jgi:hypothetical protein